MEYDKLSCYDVRFCDHYVTVNRIWSDISILQCCYH